MHEWPIPNLGVKKFYQNRKCQAYRFPVLGNTEEPEVHLSYKTTCMV